MAGAEFFGLGGTKMEAEGLTRVVRAEDVAHMGITEVLLHMPRVYGEYRRLVGAVERQRPDVAVLIDFPDVNFRLAKRLKKLGVPVVWFVSPQLWAWKRRRLRWVQEWVDRMMVIFPFEEAFYKARGVEAEFVGHPLAAQTVEMSSREEFARHAAELNQEQWAYADAGDAWNYLHKFGKAKPDPEWAKPNESNRIHYELDPNKPWIALLPGSRIGEIYRNLRGMVQTAYLLGDGYEYLVPLASTVTEDQLRKLQYELGDGLLVRPHPPRVTFVRGARGALHHARASVVASGTATVLAAVAGNPFVVVYRVSGMTYRVAKRLVSYPAEIPAQVDEAGNLPVGMVNLIAGRRVVPELLQERFTAENVAAALRPLLADGPERERMLADLAEVRAKLLLKGGEGPIQRVASAVQALLGGGT